MEAFGDVIPVNCYPKMKGRDYASLVVPGGSGQEVTRAFPVLELERVDGAWWVAPWTKRARIHLTATDRFRLSDCNPLKTVN